MRRAQGGFAVAYLLTGLAAIGIFFAGSAKVASEVGQWFQDGQANAQATDLLVASRRFRERVALVAPSSLRWAGGIGDAAFSGWLPSQGSQQPDGRLFAQNFCAGSDTLTNLPAWWTGNAATPALHPVSGKSCGAILWAPSGTQAILFPVNSRVCSAINRLTGFSANGMTLAVSQGGGVVSLSATGSPIPNVLSGFSAALASPQFCIPATDDAPSVFVTVLAK